MTRTTPLIAVALAASAGLLLTACGGSGSSSDKVTSSGTAASAPATSASPTQAQDQDQAPNAPTFDLPPDITTDFKGFTSDDPKKQAVLNDAKYAALSILEFEARINTKETPNFKRFWTGAHGAEFSDSIISQFKDGTVITGAYPYYNPVVKTLQSGNVSVQYCEDQRKAYAKDSKTGKVSVTQPSLSDFRSWTLLMTKGSSGDWTVFNHTWVQGAKQCQVA